MLSPENDPTKQVLIDRLRRVAYRQGFRVKKMHREGFIVADLREGKVVLGGDKPQGASLKDLMAFLKVAA